MGIFEAESFEKMMEIFTDPEYLERIVPDELRFFNKELMEVSAGQLATIIDK